MISSWSLILLYLSVTHLQSSQACFPRYANQDELLELLKQKEMEPFNSWTVSPEIEAEWAQWLAEYKEIYGDSNAIAAAADLIDYNDLKDDEDEEEDPNRPEWWKGTVKDGSTGRQHKFPPWAMEAIHRGIPKYCFEAITRTECYDDKETLSRYTFNPIKNECELKEFKGCVNSYNNFPTLYQCIQHCMVGRVNDHCSLTTSIEIPTDHDYAEFFPQDG